MSTFPLIVFVLALGAATVVAVMALTAIRGQQLGVVAVVDVAWGSGFVVVALVSAVVGQLLGPDGGDATFQRWFVLVLVALWGGRLAWHVRSRFNGEHAGEEDPRYAEMLGGSLAEVGLATAVKRVFVVQGTAMWVVSLPVMVGAVTDLAYWPVLVLGALVWAVGLAFETIGDRQLTAYKAEPKETRPTVMDRGLWGWTRHPNYFGDATVWWGLWLAAGLASGWAVGLATVVAPVAMTFFIRNVTGAKLLEKKMSQREGWDDYAARVPLFFPLPPGVKKSASRG
ncbi:DUF1295 domain-containing protein [Nocardioides sp. AX2bis]|uniref:DUF1295 domain-containing protein n=1 Tax=Nocardioides sp. AX2bis TaxID=2653157 RepID=UPI001F1829F3|nr:DUF1295 domain-containing protein [Nocardioides sp. AX2bis]